MAKGKYYSLKYRPATAEQEASRLYWRNGVETIEELHSLLDQDVIFLSLDLECNMSRQNEVRIMEIGVSLFDTRDLVSRDDIKITARHFHNRTGEVRGGRYFLFGKTEHANVREMPKVLRKMLVIEDAETTWHEPPPYTKDRKIVLVSHGGRSDLSHMARLGIDIQTVPNIIACIDTELIGKAIFNTPKQPSLSWLLDHLGYPKAKLHNAGNDAMFTMNVMFGLANKSGWKGTEKQIEMLREVACRPLRTEEIDERLRVKMEKRIEESKELNRWVRILRDKRDWFDDVSMEECSFLDSEWDSVATI